MPLPRPAVRDRKGGGVNKKGTPSLLNVMKEGEVKGSLEGKAKGTSVVRVVRVGTEIREVNPVACS